MSGRSSDRVQHNNTYKELLRIKQGFATGYVLLEGERALRQLEADGLTLSCLSGRVKP